ncbi:cyclic AMP-dependent transcription factor ATF-3 [Scleropages formosus]|uniref:Activating transcription factor 3 n=1 Tax=Scleropages formosus TaxID=113540 RepID=A0A8C9S0T8_SCLFO|nr:cyclic AMP-dependent transcription factor ATF-3 [Scleropages formosus]
MQLRENRADQKRTEERRRGRSERRLVTESVSVLLSLIQHTQATIIMMLQHPGLGPSEISASALVPCLSPPGSLTLDDFTNFTPLVKEELRLAIQNKRLSNGMSPVMKDCPSSSSERPVEQPVVKRELTLEEYERRKRRRERNKIAAAKCRNKKKEKTDCLQKESEKLESINAELKAQIEELKSQKQQLVYMLNLHRPTCIVRAQNGQTPEDERNLFIQQIKESTLQDLMVSPIGSSHTSTSSSCGHH